MANTTSDPYSSLDKIYNPPQMQTDAPYNDIVSWPTNSVENCATACYGDNNCVGFVTNAAGNYCWLKNNISNTNFNSDRNTYIINRNNSFNSYIQYDNLLLNDGSNKQQSTNVPSECITKCVNDPNCRGVNVILNTGQNEVSSDGYTYQDAPKATCEYVSNICYSNSKTPNPNSKFFAKKHNLHFENNVPYLLKNSGTCLSVQSDPNSNDKLLGVDCNNSDKVSPVYFDTSADTIKIGSDGDACLRYTGSDGLSLLKCNIWDQNQKFIYDHVYNSLRPISDTTQCITTTKSTQPDGTPLYTYGVAQCGKPSSSNHTTFENYYKPDPKDDYIEYYNKLHETQDYSLDLTYYTFYMVLLCIIAYLVIVSSVSKKV
jgi:hypothetical protein